jgi:hypothetical protein
MLKLETSKMTNAIATAKIVRPKVRCTGDGRYKVTGRQGNEYTVVLTSPKPGLKLGSCECAAGQAGRHCCFHIAAACSLHVAIKTTYSRPSETPRAVAAPMPVYVVARAPRVGRDFAFCA